MSINNEQNQNAQCCVDYCANTFDNGDQTIINSYKCNSKKISSADVWNVQKKRKGVSLRNHGL